MALATEQPGAIAGVVLNDIGPLIEPSGLMRIKGYVGKLPEPRRFSRKAPKFCAACPRRTFQSSMPPTGSPSHGAAGANTMDAWSRLTIRRS